MTHAVRLLSEPFPSLRTSRLRRGVHDTTRLRDLCALTLTLILVSCTRSWERKIMLTLV